MFWLAFPNKIIGTAFKALPVAFLSALVKGLSSLLLTILFTIFYLFYLLCF